MKYEAHCMIRYHLYNLTSNTPPWVFFTFFKLYKWFQIAQRILYRKKEIPLLALSMRHHFIK